MHPNPSYKTKQIIHKFRSYLEYRRLLQNPYFSNQIKALRRYQNLHAGERCFIIGNGPSLKKTDLTKLRNEKTFGLNRIYLLFDTLGFSTSYYVCSNQLVLSQFKDEITRQVPVPKFSVWENYAIANDIPQILFVYRHNAAGFYHDISKGVWGGATVTYMAMQIAFYMGFHEVILIGVDHSFSTTGTPHKIIESCGDDPNHFAPNYFGKGVLWQLPDLETSEYAYSLARKHYEHAGRSIRDATLGGKLEVFPKVDYNSLWD